MSDTTSRLFIFGILIILLVAACSPPPGEDVNEDAPHNTSTTIEVEYAENVEVELIEDGFKFSDFVRLTDNDNDIVCYYHTSDSESMRCMHLDKTGR